MTHLTGIYKSANFLHLSEVINDLSIYWSSQYSSLV